MSVRSIRKREVEASAEMEADGDELPKGWAFVRLDELTESPKLDIVSGPFGSNLKSSEYVDKGVPLIRLQNIDRAVFLEKNIRFITREKAGELSSHSFVSGDVVISKLGDPVGKACIVPLSLSAGVIVADVVRARIDEKRALSNYVVLAINSPAVISQVNLEVKGSTRPRVNLSNIREMRIPLAPLAEQRRIVGKLELLLGKVSSSLQRLSRVPGLLKRFRQSVLAAACSGKLTADWREENPDAEAASVSLANCAWSVDQKAIRHLVRRGTDGLPLVEPPEVPESWATLTVRQLVETGAILDFQDGNHGSLYPRSSEFGDVGIKFLTAQQVFDNRVLLDNTPLLNAEKAKLLRIGFAKPRDVLLTHNATVGRVAILPEYDGDVILGTSVTYYRTNANALLPEFLCYEMQGQYWQDQLRSVMEQTTRDQVSVTKQVEFRIMVPPLSEQQEIVRRVEKLFAFADQIEARLRLAAQHVDRLTKSLLAKAFRGELVPTEHAVATAEGRAYESACELLARIRAMQSSASPAKPKRGKARQT